MNHRFNPWEECPSQPNDLVHIGKHRKLRKKEDRPRLKSIITKPQPAKRKSDTQDGCE